jgi:hypothetical protein
VIFEAGITAPAQASTASGLKAEASEPAKAHPTGLAMNASQVAVTAEPGEHIIGHEPLNVRIPVRIHENSADYPATPLSALLRRRA